ncbi:hypothetical protein [Jiulongibacter sp. NS-SX5]|uniref:hypothetical protein n=1 Tax=Jiulongibacter sp. NS-SX5 TaxID=3463854 RepID=UPI00405A02CD
MLSLKKLTFTCLLAMLSYVSFGQNEVAILPVYNPSHIQLKVTSNEECLSTRTYLTPEDNKLNITAISSDEGELVLKEFKVDLVRRGRKVSSIRTKAPLVDISSLHKQALTGDVIRFTANEVYIKTPEGKEELYSIGSVNFLYTYKSSSGLVVN